MSKPVHEREEALREAQAEKEAEKKASAAAQERIRQALQPWADIHGEDSDAYRWIWSIAIETTPATAVALASMLDTLWRSYELEMMPDDGGRPTLSFVEAANLRNRTLKELRPLLALIDPRDELPDLLRVVVAFKPPAERADNRGPGLKVK
jgi:hypothetical protein